MQSSGTIACVDMKTINLYVRKKVWETYLLVFAMANLNIDRLVLFFYVNNSSTALPEQKPVVTSCSCIYFLTVKKAEYNSVTVRSQNPYHIVTKKFTGYLKDCPKWRLFHSLDGTVCPCHTQPKAAWKPIHWWWSRYIKWNGVFVIFHSVS